MESLPAGEVVAERFQLEGLLGFGAMGSVYRAVDTLSGSRVALKLVGHVGADELERFEREARTLSRVRDPGIVGYVGHGERREGAWLAMEWVEGETLESRLRRGALPARDAVDCGRRIAAALGAAHRASIVHRDVKPSNVVIDAGGRPHLLDFGIAHLSGGETVLTRTGAVLGTPSYMSPEQARGRRDVGPPSDVFSLGCVLYECLTGRRAFDGAHLMAVLTKILFGALPDLPTGIDPRLGALLLRMLDADPRRRPASGDEAAAALAAIESDLGTGDHVGAPVVSTAERRFLSLVVAGRPTGTGAEDPAPAERLATALRPFGARVERLADGSLVASLGRAPDATATDEAAAAARAALLVSELLPGTAVALVTGRSGHEGARLFGEAVDRAGSLLALPAPVGEEPGVRLDGVSRRLLDDRFVVREDETGLFLVEERAEGRGTRRVMGRISPCVGRRFEVSALEGLCLQSAEEEVATCAVIVGAAGIGKSRVRSRVLERLEEGGRRHLLLEGAGDPLAVGATFGLVSQMIRSALGRSGPLDQLRDRLAAHLRELGADRPHLSDFLGELAGIPFEPGDAVLRHARADPVVLGDQLRLAWLDWVAALCDRTPLVLVLEDLHWADTPSLQLLETTLRQLGDRRLTILAFARPEIEQQHPGLWSELGATRIHLRPLPDRAAERLVRTLLGETTPGTGTDEEAVARIVARAGGNPFYLEELVRARSRGEAALPETVAAMVAVRIAHRPPEERRALRAASVVGDGFWPSALAMMLAVDADEVARLLERLAAAELVAPVSSSSLPGEREHRFSHALVRETAYDLLTDEDRRQAHLAVARWLAGREGVEALALAEHYRRAGALSEALPYLLDASRQALAASDLTACLERSERALGSASGRLEGQLRLVRAMARRWRGELAEAGREAGAAAALLPEGSAEWFQAVEEVSTALAWQGDYEGAARRTAAAEATVPAEGAESSRLVCLAAAARQAFHAGSYAEATRLSGVLSAVLARGDREVDPAARAQIHRLVAAQARHRGDLAGDRTGYDAALRAFEAVGDVRNACNTRVSVGFASIELGDLEVARVHLEEALAGGHRLGLEPIVTRAQQNLALLLFCQGDELERARELASLAVRESAAQGNVRFEGWTRVYLARILLAMGDPEAAAAEAERASAQLEVTPPARAGALAVLARARIAGGRAGEALAPAEQAFAVLEEYGGIEEFESLVRLARAEALDALGDPRAGSAAREARFRLLERADGIGDPGWRASFLERVPENRQALALAARYVGSPPPFRPGRSAGPEPAG